MGISIIIISLAILWLLYETRFLTVRLKSGKEAEGIPIGGLINLMCAFMVVVFVMKAIASEMGVKSHKRTWIDNVKVKYAAWMKYYIGWLGETARG